MSGALDPLPLLRALHERGIEHIVVGGFAVNAHGFIRVTKDLDIVPSVQPRAPAGDEARRWAAAMAWRWGLPSPAVRRRISTELTLQ
jgi:hypothetical protein